MPSKRSLLVDDSFLLVPDTAVDAAAHRRFALDADAARFLGWTTAEAESAPDSHYNEVVSQRIADWSDGTRYCFARGHGRTDKPTTTDSYAMERLVGDVIAVLDDCEVPETAYLGYSMGGRVGFALAIRAAERVRALIVGGASHRPQNGALDRLIYPGFIDTIEIDGAESDVDKWSKRLGRPVDPTVRAVFLGNNPRALVPYLRQTDREPGFDEELVSRIQVPVLLFAGECDRERLADSQAAAAILPDAEIFVIADGDHESTLRRVVDIASRGAGLPRPHEIVVDGRRSTNPQREQSDGDLDSRYRVMPRKSTETRLPPAVWCNRRSEAAVERHSWRVCAHVNACASRACPRATEIARQVT